MSKKVTSVSIDLEIYEQLKDDESLNLSGLVNNVAKEYVETGNVDAMDIRIQQKEEYIANLEQEVEDKTEELVEEKEELEEMYEKREEVKDKTSPEMERAIDVLGNLVENGSASVDNPAVKNHASKVGMKPSKLLDTVREEHGVTEPSVDAESPPLKSLADGGTVKEEDDC